MRRSAGSSAANSSWTRQTWLGVLPPHQRSAQIQQTFMEHHLCARPVKRGNSETEGGQRKGSMKINKNEKTRGHRSGGKSGPKAGNGNEGGCGGIPGRRPLPPGLSPWVGEGGAPASPAATASLEPPRVCKARTLAHYCNYVALSLPGP